MTKVCTECGEKKPANEYHKLKSGKFGVAAECKPCANAKRSLRSKQNRPARYGITWDDYHRMLAEQGGKCAICDTDTPGSGREAWCIDHDHETGLVRGLLCNACNKGLGHFRDDVAILQKAQEYLLKVPKS